MFFLSLVGISGILVISIKKFGSNEGNRIISHKRNHNRDDGPDGHVCGRGHSGCCCLSGEALLGPRGVELFAACMCKTALAGN